jgi:hypothetical protein
MKTDLLLKLAERLEEPMPEHFTFDMREWLIDNEDDYVEGGCGTAGCAIGLACSQLPEFAALQLRVGSLPRLEGNGSTQTNYFAVATFLGISLHDAYYLFCASYYEVEYDHHYGYLEVTPRQVASRIREFVTRETLAAEHRERVRV